ncbi:efflux RND transporter periplasmic adaptor subunit [Effusibacillus lacus]|uniref:Uncharacterized protein n=1 Tax=Effusibacillus lacus TaxID=1348429 RepID=A0A292YTF1_9BACL|nr:efflux RND transporter periplasmic adaptor subunit [Effusibacillus lacus]TCS73756.1 RND family efflux transporter MFP subunit [Effusibacillus lacus]GAX92033.1 hypothetical protein EFBL_3724 [Effusibacillus lacus]
MNEGNCMNANHPIDGNHSAGRNSLSSWKRWPALTLALGLLVSQPLIAGCSSKSKATDAQDKSVPVVVQTVAEGNIEQTITMTGTAEANAVIQLSSKTGGKVVSIPVAVGSQVQANDVLLQLEETDLRNALRQAEASLNSAKANLAQVRASQETGAVQAENGLVQARQALEDAKANFARMENLFKAGAISRQQFDQAKTALVNAEAAYNNAVAAQQSSARSEAVKVAEQAVNQAQVGYDIAANNLANATIRAPQAGTVAAISTEVGQMASPSAPLVTLVDMSRMKVKLEIPESSLPYFQQGSTVEIEFDSMGLKTTGKVDSVSPLNNTPSKGYPVVVVIDNADAKIKPGMVAKLTISRSISDNQKKGMKVPTDAILTIDGKTYVYVADGDKAVKREIKVEEQTSTDSLISGDIKPGDKIIVRGHTLLKEDSKIRIVEK